MDKSAWDISYELERILEKKFGCEFAQTGTIFDRNRIEKDMFYDVMHLLLQMNGKEGSVEFLNKYCKYKELPVEKIPNFQIIFEEFKNLLEL